MKRIFLKDFFDGVFSCEEIVMCIYGLNQLEFETFCALLSLKKADVIKIMRFLERKDRTMVNRALKKLENQGLCTRKKKSQKGQRGYWMQYYPKPLGELQNELRIKIETWYDWATGEIGVMQERFREKHMVKAT